MGQQPRAAEAQEVTLLARKSNALSVAVIAVVVPALVATVALPAYAYTPAPDTTAAVQAAQLTRLTAIEAQSVFVIPDAPAVAVARDGFGITPAAQLQAASTSSTWSYLENPPLPAGFSLDQVISIALGYQGVPYLYGGADPSGFDCSGFVMYVYAQVGVGLSHGAGSQAGAGTPIATSAALPGDVIIMDGHDGFYMGGGMILDAPQEGGVVSVRPLWTSNYYVVRFGI